MIDFKYRPDVDGLRAVAVTLVLLFHAGLGFSGGFIGVDVFFVISGFLITGLILKEQATGRFSLANFWIRRIRRIIPAATVMVAAVMAAGFFLLLPGDYADLGESTIAQQFMLSNVYFWRDTGYFDEPAELKPLLHTWSLAIEEQFYVGYPFLLMLLHRFGRRSTFIVLGLLCVGSLAISQYGVQHHPSATFFLLPTRAWELLTGALICFMPRPSRIKVWILAFSSWISLGAILATGWFYSSATPFPGMLALVPCVATGVFIYANSIRLTSPAVVLATQPIVFIGLISYSLYLWHWPLLAYAHYWLGTDLGPVVSVSALVVSFALAVASWKYVETPLRKGQILSSPAKVACGAIASVCLITATSSWVNIRHGFVERLPEHVRKVAQPIEHPRSLPVTIREIRNGQLPVLGDSRQRTETPDFIVWGDSHALALDSCIDAIASDYHLRGVVAARWGTVPIPGVWRPGYKKYAAEAPRWNQAVLEFIRQNKIKNVILAARWAVNIEARPNGETNSLIANEGDSSANVESARIAFDAGLARALDELEALGVKVWILKQVPLQRFSPQRAIVRGLYFQSEIPKGVSLEEHRERQESANAIIDSHVQGRQRVSAVDLSAGLFDTDGRSFLGSLQGSFYQDDNHISDFGAKELLRPVLETVLAEISRTKSRE